MAISPGVTTGELMSFFLQFDVCFESDVVLPTVTYGGVFSGGCHVSRPFVQHECRSPLHISSYITYRLMIVNSVSCYST